MSTGVHEILPSAAGLRSASGISEVTRGGGQMAWAAGFYAAIVIAVVLLLVRGMWPPENRLTPDRTSVTQVR